VVDLGEDWPPPSGGIPPPPFLPLQRRGRIKIFSFPPPSLKKGERLRFFYFLPLFEYFDRGRASVRFSPVLLDACLR